MAKPPSEQSNTPMSEGKTPSRMLGYVVLILLAWSPAFFTIALVDHYSVDIPVWDDFERVPLIEQYENGELTLEFLVSPHIEHRILIPRLIILVNHIVGGGDIQNEVWVIVLSMLVSSICIGILIMKTLGGGAMGWFIVFLANLTIFSLMQYQNLCWAIQTAFVLPLMFLSLTLLTLHSRLPLAAKLGVCFFWALCATFCFAHGLIVWLLVLGYFLLSPDLKMAKSRLGVAGAWAAITAIAFALYFNNLSSTSHFVHSYFQNPGETPPGLAGILNGESELGPVILYSLKSLGSQFSRYAFMPPDEVAPIVGALQLGFLVLLATIAIAYCLRNRDTEAWRRALPWIALGGYVCVTVLVMALGRAHLSLGRAMSPRYLGITLYITVALIVLVPLVASLLLRKDSKWSGLTRSFGFGFVGVFLALLLWNNLYGAHCLGAWSASRWQSLMVMSFRDFSPSQYPYRADQSDEFVRDYVDRMRALGIAGGIPDPYGPGDFDRFSVSKLKLNPHRANFTHNEPLTEPFDGWALEGFAYARQKMGRVPDGVLFTCDVDGERIIVGYGESFPIMPFYTHRWDSEFTYLDQQDHRDQARFTARIDRRNLPEGVMLPVELTAWVIDFKEDRLYELETKVTLREHH